MQRHLALPIGFAAAFHAALLFGFSKTPSIATVREPTTKSIPFPLPPEVLEIILEPEASTSEKASSPEKPVPTTPELLVLPTVDSFKLQPPPIDVVLDLDSRIIPTTRPSLERGDSEGPSGPAMILGRDLDNPPRTRFQSNPIYPHEGRREGLRGEVLVEFRVDESGRVNDPRVIRSSHRMFEDPTLRAVARWQFEPGRRDGRIVSFRMALPVIFNIED